MGSSSTLSRLLPGGARSAGTLISRLDALTDWDVTDHPVQTFNKYTSPRSFLYSPPRSFQYSETESEVDQKREGEEEKVEDNDLWSEGESDGNLDSYWHRNNDSPVQRRQ